MFIFRLLNIIVGQIVRLNDKARSSARKGLGKLRISECKNACLQRIVLYFNVVTVNTENYNQQIRYLHLRKLQSAKSFSTSQKITISKAFLRRSLHRRRLQSANPSQGKNHKKGKERRKKKEKRNNGGGGT